jgi:hypothetical protein
VDLDFDTECNERYFRCVSLYATQEQQSTYTMITFRRCQRRRMALCSRGARLDCPHQRSPPKISQYRTRRSHGGKGCGFYTHFWRPSGRRDGTDLCKSTSRHREIYEETPATIRRKSLQERLGFTNVQLICRWREVAYAEPELLHTR